MKTIKSTLNIFFLQNIEVCFINFGQSVKLKKLYIYLDETIQKNHDRHGSQLYG